MGRLAQAVVGAIPEGRIGDEIGWASLMLYGGRREPVVWRVTWKVRYAVAAD